MTDNADRAGASAADDEARRGEREMALELAWRWPDRGILEGVR